MTLESTGWNTEWHRMVICHRKGISRIQMTHCLKIRDDDLCGKCTEHIKSQSLLDEEEMILQKQKEHLNELTKNAKPRGKKGSKNRKDKKKSS